MRHFGYLDPADAGALFQRNPQEFTGASPRRALAAALGATLYMPGTRPRMAADIARNAAAGAVSLVACLEDAISDADVPAAERNVIAQFTECAASDTPPPLLFIRVRAADQIGRIVSGLGPAASVLCGFVVPKFTADSGDMLQAVVDAGTAAGRHFYAMPVIESPEMMFAETRHVRLMMAYDLVERFRDHVLAVRVGGTDLCGLYGLRRDRDLTIWDIAVVRDVLSEILNIFARGGRYAVTGAVWEYFSSGERLFKSQMRESPFRRTDLPGASEVRTQLLRKDLDGLLREAVLDKATGMTGKTVIHPRHVRLVHAVSVVTSEEYADARDIIDLDEAGGGVRASASGGTMLEGRPHRLWALQTLARADAFGVLAPGRTFVDLLDDEWRHE